MPQQNKTFTTKPALSLLVYKVEGDGNNALRKLHNQYIRRAQFLSALEASTKDVIFYVRAAANIGTLIAQ